MLHQIVDPAQNTPHRKTSIGLQSQKKSAHVIGTYKTKRELMSLNLTLRANTTLAKQNVQIREAPPVHSQTKSDRLFCAQTLIMNNKTVPLAFIRD